MELQNSLFLIAPEILLAVGGLVLLLIAAWAGDKAARLISILAVAYLVGAGALVSPSLFALDAGGATAFTGLLQIDAFSGFAKLLILMCGISVLIVAPSYFDRVGAMRGELSILILFATLGMMIMVAAGDLLSLYLGLELSSLAGYVLASFLRDNERSAEAGLKYFVLGALASGILLFGMSLVYGFTGSTNFDAISTAISGDLSMGALFGVIFVLAGLAFKISAVPFHMWTPDVYEGAPTPITAFFASAPKVAALALTMRVALEAFGSQAFAWQQVIIFAALASIVVGALGAIGQDNIKRLLAYSSINNVGFILIGLSVATQDGASAMLVYLAIYAAMTIGSFVAVLMLIDGEGKPVEGISDIAGLSTTKPLLALCLAALMFSLAGIPPLFGFWGKFVVFQAAVEAGWVALAAIGIAASVIGAFYYIKIVKVMYFDDPAEVVTGKSDTAHWALLGLMTLIISPLGYFLTTWLGSWADKAASALMFAA